MLPVPILTRLLSHCPDPVPPTFTHTFDTDYSLFLATVSTFGCHQSVLSVSSSSFTVHSFTSFASLSLSPCYFYQIMENWFPGCLLFSVYTHSLFCRWVSSFECPTTISNLSSDSLPNQIHLYLSTSHWMATPSFQLLQWKPQSLLWLLYFSHTPHLPFAECCRFCPQEISTLLLLLIAGADASVSHSSSFPDASAFTLTSRISVSILPSQDT